MSEAVTHALPDEPYIAIATMTVVPARRADFLRAMEMVMKQSAREEGLISFQLVANRQDPNIFTAVDVFRDRAAYDTHLQMPYTGQLVAQLDGCLVGEAASTFHHQISTDVSCRAKI